MILAVITIVIVILLTAIHICGRIKESKSDWGISSKLVNLSIPKDVKVLNSSDTHGGLLGDGEYFAVFQFTEIQYAEFFNGLSQNGMWIDLPLSPVLNKFIFGERKVNGDSIEIYEGHGKNKIPKNIRHGKYYFRDKFIENYPQYNGTNFFERPASNFIFALLDTDDKKLYIMKYDS